jgi:hypothetical protein
MQTVAEYIDALEHDWQREIAGKLRQIVHEAVPNAEERIQYGKPHFRHRGEYAAVITPAKAYVSFTIFRATSVHTPEGLFEVSDSGDRKTIKIKPGQDVDYAMLGSLLRQAAGD